MALISLIIALVITAILAVIVIRMYTGGGKGGEAEVKTPIERAHSVECLAQRRKLDIAIKLYQVEKGTLPSSLSELPGLSEQDFRCPVTGSAYDYNPSSGRVSCPDHP